MKISLRIHPSLFVIRSSNGSAIVDSKDILDKLGKIEPLGKYINLCLLYVDSPSDDPKETWRQVRERLGPEFDLHPVYIDDRGNIGYPTGLLWVQFIQAPSDEELDVYARLWGLRVKARSRYMPNEITFEQTDSTRYKYLPEIIESIQSDIQNVGAVSSINISKLKRV